MALNSTAITAVLSSVLRWGVYDLLKAAERRCTRLTCREMRQAVDVLPDTLVLHVDSASCSDAATAEAMAAFHSSRPAPTQLVVHMGYDARSEETAAGSFIASYTAYVAASLATVKKCRVSVRPGCKVQQLPCISPLQGLPALQVLAVKSEHADPFTLPAPCPLADTPALIFKALADCKELHTLAVDGGLARQREP